MIARQLQFFDRDEYLYPQPDIGQHVRFKDTGVMFECAMRKVSNFTVHSSASVFTASK